MVGRHGADLSDVNVPEEPPSIERTVPTEVCLSGRILWMCYAPKLQKKALGARVNSRAVKLLLDKDYKIAGAIVHGKHSGYYKIAAKAVVFGNRRLRSE